MHPKCPHLARSLDSSKTTSPTMSDQLSTLPISATLKALTQPQHDEAERHPLHAVLFGSQGPAAARDAYTRLLWQHSHIQRAFEPLLRRAAEQTHTFRTMVRPHHFHLDALIGDLNALGVDVPRREPLPATCRFVSFIESCDAHDGFPLLGVWYVFEGSTNGGTIIGKKVRELLSLDSDAGTRFINPHGTLVRARWSEWKQALDALTIDQTHKDFAISSAQEAFRQSRAVLNDVLSEMRLAQAEAPRVTVFVERQASTTGERS